MSLFAIGSYTKHPTLDARGAGITVIRLDDETGRRETVDVRSEITNPSYLDWRPADRRLYAVSEVGERMGAVAAYAADGDGRLEFLGQREGPGRSACNLLARPAAGRILTASYSDGRLTSYELTSGAPGPPVMSRVYEGSGPNAERQQGPHAHQVTADPFAGRLYVCDLGSDAVWMHEADAVDDPGVPPLKALAAPPGYGPRHLAWDPHLPAAYLLCELEPKLLACRLDPTDGRMEILQELDTVPPDRAVLAAPAAVKLHPSGRTLAVSNRFDDTIAVFALDRSAGAGRGDSPAAGAGVAAVPRLSLLDRFPCRGRAPRDIEFDSAGRRLFIANQDSHAVTCRLFDAETGRPAEAGGEEAWEAPIETGSPVCVVMMPGE